MRYAIYVIKDHWPKTGVSVVIRRDNNILLGKRKGSHGEGQWSTPGGHMDYNETISQTIRRELDEEVGPQLIIKNLAFLCLTNMRIYHPKHYTDIGLTADWVEGEPILMEPNKCEGWGWYPLDDLPGPRPFFGSVENYLRTMQDPSLRFFEDAEPVTVWQPNS